MVSPPPSPPLVGGDDDDRGPSRAGAAATNAATAAAGSSATTPHQYAQQMNNSAASCIEIGLYGRAAMSLKRALRLSQKCHRDAPGLVGAPCDCTLDSCIVYSEALASAQQRRQAARGTIPRILCQEQQQPQNNSTEDAASVEESVAARIRVGFTHRTPIQVKRQGHIPGPALCLVITFNLALTHHLMALKHHQQHPRCNTSSGEFTKNAKKARDLYRLTYQTLTSLLRQQEGNPSPHAEALRKSIQSIRFELILLNNLGEVYNLTRQPDERDSTLEKLLSTTMVVVDHNIRAVEEDDVGEEQPMDTIHNDVVVATGRPNDTTATHSNNNNDNHSQSNRSRSSHSSSSHSSNSSSSSSSSRLSGGSGPNGQWKINLDGYLANTMHLVLQPKHTSNAA